MNKKLLSILLVISFILIGCNKDNNILELESKYYNNESFIEINNKTLDEIKSNKETFGLFIYEPTCITSNEFNNVLIEFMKKYKISFYKIPYSKIKNTELGKKIKYYPSFIIYQNGKIIDYLEADKNEDLKRYKNVDEFKQWFTKYIKIKNIINIE